MNKALSEPQALEKSLRHGVAGLATLPALAYALINTQVVVDLNKQGFQEDPASAGFFLVNGEWSMVNSSLALRFSCDPAALKTFRLSPFACSLQLANLANIY